MADTARMIGRTAAPGISTRAQPRLASHAGLSAEERHRLGIVDGLVRLSLGIEDTADRIADLDPAVRAP